MYNDELKQAILEFESVKCRAREMIRSHKYEGKVSLMRDLFIARELLDRILVVSESPRHKAIISGCIDLFDAREQPDNDETNLIWVSWIHVRSKMCSDSLQEILVEYEASLEKNS